MALTIRDLAARVSRLEGELEAPARKGRHARALVTRAELEAALDELRGELGAAPAVSPASLPDGGK